MRLRLTLDVTAFCRYQQRAAAVRAMHPMRPDEDVIAYLRRIADIVADTWPEEEPMTTPNPTPEQRAQWRTDAQHGASDAFADYAEASRRILALLDALDAAEEEVRREARAWGQVSARAERAEAALARVEALCQRWDGLSKGEGATTAVIRAALRGEA